MKNTALDVRFTLRAIFAGLILLTGSAYAQDGFTLPYHESFDNPNPSRQDGGNLQLADKGWTGMRTAVEGGNALAISWSDGDRRSVDPSGGVFAFYWDLAEVQYLIYTETTIPADIRTAIGHVAFSYSAGNVPFNHVAHVLVQVGGEWYVNTDNLTGLVDHPMPRDHYRDAGMDWTEEAGAWRPITIMMSDDEGVLASVEIGEPLAEPLPAGDITAFGWYAERDPTVAGGSFYLDEFQISEGPFIPAMPVTLPYHEPFDNPNPSREDGGNLQLADKGWTGMRTPVEGGNALAISWRDGDARSDDPSGGVFAFYWDRTEVAYLIYSEKNYVPYEQVDLIKSIQFSYSASNTPFYLVAHALVRIGSSWYVSADNLTPTPVTYVNARTWYIDAGMNFTRVPSAWRHLTVDHGDTPGSIVSATVGDLLTDPLPDGDLTFFGWLAFRDPSVTGGSFYLDEFKLSMDAFVPPILPWYGGEPVEDVALGFDGSFGEIVHPEHGNQLLVSSDGVDLYMYDSIIASWLYTNATLYEKGSIYRWDPGGWLYYLAGGTPERRLFYDWSAGAWIEVAAEMP